MTRFPIEFPWQVLVCLAAAILLLGGACVVGVCGWVRGVRARRANRRPGYVEDFWPVGSDRWFR